MSCAIPAHQEAKTLSAMPRFLAGLLLCGALLPWAATPASAASLSWADPAVEWPAGSLGPHTFPLTDGNGVTATITVSQPSPPVGVFEGGYPAEDCAGECTINNFGSSHDLGIRFDPAKGTPIVTSPVTIEVTFSSPVTQLRFEVSDIDFSVAGIEDNKDQDHRRDQIVVTSNAGNPTLSYKALPSTFTISGTTATANCTGTEPTCSASDTTAAVPLPGNNQNPDSGTVVADFGALSVTTVTITYNEAGDGPNPAGRGVGFLANLVAAAQSPPVAVPALDTMGLALLTVLLALAGAVFLRRRPVHRQ